MDSAASGMSALLLLTHTLTHNRKSASGFSGLFSKPNRHFLSHAAPIGLEITLLFLQGDFGTKRPCVQVTSLRPVKAPGSRVFMRFPGVFVFRWFPVLFAADPYRDPYGIGRVVFGRLVCPLFYAAAILFRSALYERLGFLTPTFVQKCPNPPVWGIWRVWFLPWLPPLFRSEIGAFLP